MICTPSQKPKTNHVPNRTHDDRDRIQVLDQIVWRAVQFHRCSNSTEITVDLRVAKPVKGEEQEDLAGFHRAIHFANKFIVPSDGGRCLTLRVVARFGRLPESGCTNIPDELDWVPAESGSQGKLAYTRRLMTTIR